MTGALSAAALVAAATLLMFLGWSRAPMPARPVAQLRRAGRPRGRRGRRVQRAALAEALLVLDSVAPALRVGLSSSTALAHLAATNPLDSGLAGELAIAASSPFRTAGSSVRASPIGQIWWQAAQRSGADELKLVAAAWTLADVSGVALADSVELAARLLRESRARRARLDVLLAGPRATMSLLTLLPVAGPVVGLLFGIAPLTLYAGSPISLLSAACGSAMLATGWLWCRRLLRRALSARAAPASAASAGSRGGGRAVNRSGDPTHRR